MALRFDMAPFDELHIGKCVLKNSHGRALFIIEGDTPVLKAKDFLSTEKAAKTLEKLYCCIQGMYLEEAHQEYQGSYAAFMARSLSEHLDLASDLQSVDQWVISRDYYKALKLLKKWIGSAAFIVDQKPSANYVPRYSGWKKAL